MMDHRKVDFDYDYREFKRQIADLDVRITAWKALLLFILTWKISTDVLWTGIIDFTSSHLHILTGMRIILCFSPNAYLIADCHPEIHWNFIRQITNHNALIKVVDDIRETKS